VCPNPSRVISAERIGHEVLHGIVKIEIRLPEAREIIKQFAENPILALESFVTGIRKVAEEAIDNILNLEIDFFLGKSEESSNKRNGYKERDYTFKGLETIRIKMPVDRKRRFNRTNRN
jgi:transposase-like protein